MYKFRFARWFLWIAACAAFIVLIYNMSWWQAWMGALFPAEQSVVYPTASLVVLVAEHIRLVAVSSALTVAIGLPLGIWLTRRSGREFLPIVSDLTAFGQTFPPVAVLALAVPVFGFGLVPTVIALFLYGLLPVVRNTVAGVRSVSPVVIEVAHGMGMTSSRALMSVEMPLSAPVILAGIRTSVVINVGTAMIGAVIGAGGLGAPIIAGLVGFNTAYVLEGAIPAALLAILLDQLIANIENVFTYPH